MWRRAWRAAPWDGTGWGSGDPEIARALSWAVRRYWARFPSPLRPLLKVGSRALWTLKALWLVPHFARWRGLSVKQASLLLADCLLSGALPLEAWAWRRLYGARHPLPGRAVGILLSRLGDPAACALLTDKIATAAVLTKAGVSAPVTLGVIPQGWKGDTDDRTVAGFDGRSAFLKPRRGHGGRGAAAADDDPAARRRQIACLARCDDVLAQAPLAVHPELADLAGGAWPPTLRLTTVRLPGGAPELHSAFLSVAVPGRNPRAYLDGAVRIEIDPTSGRLGRGILLADPTATLGALPWNGAMITGRAVPGFAVAVAAAITAMAALPPRPVVSWDVAPTSTGPVVIEGNACGDWILSMFPAAGGAPPPSLAPLLTAWIVE